MKRIGKIATAVAMVLGLFGTVAVLEVAEAPPAAAHNQDAYSYWYCSKHRYNSFTTVIHSEVYGLWPGQIGYECQDQNGPYRRQYWVIVSPPFSDNSWAPWPFQLCAPQGTANCPVK